MPLDWWFDTQTQCMLLLVVFQIRYGPSTGRWHRAIIVTCCLKTWWKTIVLCVATPLLEIGYIVWCIFPSMLQFWTLVICGGIHCKHEKMCRKLKRVPEGNMCVDVKLSLTGVKMANRIALFKYYNICKSSFTFIFQEYDPAVVSGRPPISKKATASDCITPLPMSVYV